MIICTREFAEAHGLARCPAEVGLQLRLQYPNQPKGEWIMVAMDAVSDSLGALCVFRVEHDSDDRWLATYDGRPGFVWYPGSRWVFVRSK